MMTPHTFLANHEHTAAGATLSPKSGGVALAQVRSAMEDLAKEGRDTEAMEYALAALAAVLQQSSALELLVAKLRAAGVGKRSERTNAEQLTLLLEELMKQAPQADRDPESEARDRARVIGSAR